MRPFVLVLGLIPGASCLLRAACDGSLALSESQRREESSASDPGDPPPPPLFTLTLAKCFREAIAARNVRGLDIPFESLGSHKSRSIFLFPERLGGNKVPRKPALAACAPVQRFSFSPLRPVTSARRSQHPPGRPPRCAHANAEDANADLLRRPPSKIRVDLQRSLGRPPAHFSRIRCTLPTAK